MKLIALSNGGFVKVDDQDYDALNRWTWRQEHGYAVRGERPNGGEQRGKYRQIRMHRVIIGAPSGIDVDHRDLDELNNQRHNLRLADPTQSTANRRCCCDNSIGLKGVRTVGMHYKAMIRGYGKIRDLGPFRNPADAARAYDRAAIELFGEFARTNAMMYPERIRDWDLLMGFVARANADRTRKWHSYVSAQKLRRMAAQIAA